jgi:hypothetical protein
VLFYRELFSREQVGVCGLVLGRDSFGLVSLFAYGFQSGAAWIRMYYGWLVAAWKGGCGEESPPHNVPGPTKRMAVQLGVLAIFNRWNGHYL